MRKLALLVAFAICAATVTGAAAVTDPPAPFLIGDHFGAAEVTVDANGKFYVYCTAKAAAVPQGKSIFWVEMVATYPGCAENDEWGLDHVDFPGSGSYHCPQPYGGGAWTAHMHRTFPPTTKVGQYISTNGKCQVRCVLTDANTKPWTTVLTDTVWVYVNP